MRSTLTYVGAYQSTRMTPCRHCGRTVGNGSSAVVDDAAPWLAIHADCVRSLVPERVEQLCLDLEAVEQKSRSSHAGLRKRVEELRSEIALLGDLFDGKRSFIPDYFRPGRLRRR